MMMKIVINGIEIELRYSLRMYIAFEKIRGTVYGGATVEDSVILFYCAIVSSKRDFILDYEQFIDWLDDDKSLLDEFNEWLIMWMDHDADKKKAKAKEKS